MRYATEASARRGYLLYVAGAVRSKGDRHERAIFEAFGNYTLKLRIISLQIAMFEAETCFFPCGEIIFNYIHLVKFSKEIFWSGSFEGVDTSPAETSTT